MNLPYCDIIVAMVAGIATPTNASDVAITAAPYASGGLFTNPVLPVEKEIVTITVRATVEGGSPDHIIADLTIVAPDGAEQHYPVALVSEKDQATGSIEWEAGRNGLYTVIAKLAPARAMAEGNETNNTVQIVLPVIVPDKQLHFVWYREVPTMRWTTCVTSANDPTQRQRLAERGVIPLNWEYGGASWSYYDKEKAEDEPAAVLKELKEVFDSKFMGELAEYSRGKGIDETGGYPGTWKEQASAASMRALVRAKQQHPERFFAVWHGGGLRRELAQYYRQGVDLLLLETYVFRAIPQALSINDIYQMIGDRLHPLIRSADMFSPAYGNYCYTLIALDSSERPDYIDLGEQEQVIRFIRRICPEMCGIAWYNGGYGGYGLEKSPATDSHHEAVLANADQLFFDYYIKPCVTLMRESLWLGKNEEGKDELTAAVSNIGGIDSNEVTVEFRVDGKHIAIKTAPSVPAGPNRTANRVLLKQTLSLQPGLHEFEARLVEASDATVLDAVARCERMVQ